MLAPFLRWRNQIQGWRRKAMGVDDSFLPGRQDMSLHLSRPSVDIVGRIASLFHLTLRPCFLGCGQWIFCVCIGSILNLMVGSLDPWPNRLLRYAVASVSYRCRQCATVWPGCLPMAFRSSCHTGNLSTPFKAICSMQLFFQTTSCESTWHSATNPMLSLLSLFLGTESQVWISATTFAEWNGCSFKGNWPLIACAKWHFLCVSP